MIGRGGQSPYMVKNTQRLPVSGKLGAEKASRVGGDVVIELPINSHLESIREGIEDWRNRNLSLFLLLLAETNLWPELEFITKV